MDKKHLLWIIPLCIIIGIGIGYYWHYSSTLYRNLTWYKCCLDGMLDHCSNATVNNLQSMLIN